ncbi:hypothetical protein PAUR_a1523 [Pseudoalteromonas aurantia 208]|uniref:Uncharacterized protein n=1 Tax=Pseudoalteromonas aurantia 208 TaxID=1314867 RepID=A0ABR9EAL9_9GAMM|nr:hypothetical protein [Pseudoalteromonas aurantia 208]
MRGGFNRIIFWVLGGKNSIDSEVIVTNADGNVFGKPAASSTHITVIRNAQMMTRMHVQKIAKLLCGG